MLDTRTVSSRILTPPRSSPSLLRRVLQRPLTYTIGNPVLTLMGAATTIIAPMILDPAAFVTFSLAMVMFQYLGDFDLGLNRLIDRRFAVAKSPTNQQSDAEAIGDITIARFAIALTIIAALLCAAPFIGSVYTLAGIGGVGFMLTIGPIAFNRARSNIYLFTLVAFINSIGMIVPRLMGLLIAGVQGCIVGLLIWYSGTAISFNIPFLRAIHRVPRPGAILGLYAASLPLFAYGNLWVFYLLTPRWFSAALAPADQAGLFAFGANLIWIGVGVISAGAQVYYPKHLMARDQKALQRQMLALTVLASVGIMLASLLCRYELAVVFPKFAAANRSTAMLLIGAIPIALAAWILPITIATTPRPWREAVVIFGIAIATLLVTMFLGDRINGIVGQALGCTFTALMVLVMMLIALHRHDMLSWGRGWSVLLGVVTTMALCGTEWLYLFGGAL